jgi:hypothetical protein
MLNEGAAPNLVDEACGRRGRRSFEIAARRGSISILGNVTVLDSAEPIGADDAARSSERLALHAR